MSVEIAITVSYSIISGIADVCDDVIKGHPVTMTIIAKMKVNLFVYMYIILTRKTLVIRKQFHLQM